MTSTTAVSQKNSNLGAAKATKNDEFYTQWADIEREMNAYLDYDPDVFRDKTILLPCDDPEWSNFAKFFALHFHDYGLKKLIATSYAPDSNPDLPSYQPTLFETEAPQFDATKTRANGKLFVLDRDINGDGIINIDDLQWEYLDGDGDFRSDEVIALRDEADIVITNPPFSLFAEFINWLIGGRKSFVVIGSNSAPTTKEIFPLIRDNKLWFGYGFNRGNAYFRVPEGCESNYANGVYDPKTGLVKFRNVNWYTNIEHGRRHEPLQLMTIDDNIKFSKHKEIRGIGYQTYDNFDAINVPFTDAIPSDYDEVMGVPVSFLSRYNPDQFEIVGITTSYDKQQSKRYPKQIQVNPNGTRKEVGKLNDAPSIKVASPPAGKTYYIVGDDTYVLAYHRILIRRKVGA
jgi:hypothetical protein